MNGIVQHLRIIACLYTAICVVGITESIKAGALCLLICALLIATERREPTP